jgi:hypothetical protein
MPASSSASRRSPPLYSADRFAAWRHARRDHSGTESLFSGLVNSDYKDVFSFSLLVLVLVFRPQGLLPSSCVEGVAMSSTTKNPLMSKKSG